MQTQYKLPTPTPSQHAQVPIMVHPPPYVDPRVDQVVMGMPKLPMWLIKGEATRDLRPFLYLKMELCLTPLPPLYNKLVTLSRVFMSLGVNNLSLPVNKHL